MSETVWGVVVPLIYFAMFLVAFGSIFRLVLNRQRFAPHDLIDRAMRIGIGYVVLLCLFLLIVLPRSWWTFVILLCVVGAGYMWLIGRGGHILEDERQQAVEDAARASDTTEDTQPNTDK